MRKASSRLTASHETLQSAHGAEVRRSPSRATTTGEHAAPAAVPPGSQENNAAATCGAKPPPKLLDSSKKGTPARPSQLPTADTTMPLAHVVHLSEGAD
jgi:hypothetical protein